MKRLILLVSLTIMFSFVNLAVCQDAKKPLPDDPEMLALIENECILNIQLIDQKKERMQIDFQILNAQRMQWEMRLNEVGEKIEEVGGTSRLKKIEPPKGKDKEKGKMEKDEKTK